MPARAAAAGRPRAPVPACLRPRRRRRRPSAARTAAPRARAQSARREHDFCLQAGFPPGHDGRGPPASSRQNVSVAARPPPGRGPGAPRGARAGGCASGTRGAAPGRPRPGVRSRRWTRGGGSASGGAAGTGRGGDPRAGRGVRGRGRGVGSGRRGERGAAAQGGVRACTLVSFEIRGCWSPRGPVKDPFAKIPFPWQESERRGEEEKRGEDNYKALREPGVLYCRN